MLSYLEWRRKVYPRGAPAHIVEPRTHFGAVYADYLDNKGRPVLVVRARYAAPQVGGLMYVGGVGVFGATIPAPPPPPPAPPPFPLPAVVNRVSIGWEWEFFG